METLYAKALFVGQKMGEGPYAGRKVFTFRASSDVTDRHNEVLTLDGWELGDYTRNPVILDTHDYTTIRSIIGRSIATRQAPEGLETDVVYARSELGQLAENLVEDGMLNAVSVGFKPLDIKRPSAPGEPLQHTRKALLEISMVGVPANQDALRIRGLTAKPPTKAADLQTQMDFSTAMEDLWRQRWQIEHSLRMANDSACEDENLTAEGKLAAIAVNLTQYQGLMLEWFKAYLALDEQAEAAGIDVTCGAESDGIAALRAASDALVAKAGRKLSSATVEALKAVLGHINEASQAKKRAKAVLTGLVAAATAAPADEDEGAPKQSKSAGDPGGEDDPGEEPTQEAAQGGGDGQADEDEGLKNIDLTTLEAFVARQ